MPLRKSPLRTPALVAACRDNARKSHGPKTIRGKARSSLNALKHGRFAVDLRRKLIEAGDRQGEALYARIEVRVAEAFCSSGSSWVPAYTGTTTKVENVTPAQAGVYGRPERSAEDERQLRRLTSLVWCFAARHRPQTPPAPKTILECAMESMGCSARDIPRTGIQLHDGRRRIGLVFWLQRRRLPSFSSFWKRFRKEFERAADAGLETSAAEARQQLAESAIATAGNWENGLRSRIFRLRRPNIWARLTYGVDRNGVYRPELEMEGRRQLKRLCLAGVPVGSWPALLGNAPPVNWGLIPFGFGNVATDCKSSFFADRQCPTGMRSHPIEGGS